MSVSRIRRTLAAIGIGGLLAAGSVTVTTQPAHADSGDLVSWAAANGFSGTPRSILIHGSLVCADLSMGMNGEQAANDLWRNTGIVALDDARLFVIASVENLCPQYDHRGQAPAPQAAGDFGPVLR